jgi:hypothetical protein
MWRSSSTSCFSKVVSSTNSANSNNIVAIAKNEFGRRASGIGSRNVNSSYIRMSSSSMGMGDRWGAYTTPYEVQMAQKALKFNMIPKSDHGEFLEYSVIHTDRSLNLMSSPFQQVMKDLNVLLKTTYSADKVAIMPGYVTCLKCWNTK